MSTAIRNSLKELRILSLSLPSAARQQLSNLSDILCTAIAEAALNLVKNSEIEITPQQNRLLQKFKKDILLLANNEKICWKAKRKVIEKRGYKFVPTLLQTVLAHVEGVRGALSVRIPASEKQPSTSATGSKQPRSRSTKKRQRN